MALIEEALKQILQTDPVVNAAVQGRVRPIRSQSNAVFPHITYQRISTQRPLTHDGTTNTARPRFQIDVWAQTYEGVRTLADAVVRRLHGFRGVVLGVNVMAVGNENDLDALEQPSGTYRVPLDFFIWHKEA